MIRSCDYSLLDRLTPLILSLHVHDRSLSDELHLYWSLVFYQISAPDVYKKNDSPFDESFSMIEMLNYRFTLYSGLPSPSTVKYAA